MIHNVRDYGARGNGRDSDWQAVLAALDRCREDNGGTLYFPAGDYPCGTLSLCDNLTIHLETGATLWESEDLDSVEPTRTLLRAEDVGNIAITGHGAIHGLGKPDEPPPERKAAKCNTTLIYFTGCRNVRITGIQVMYSEFWTLHLRHCHDVVVDGVTILGNKFRVVGARNNDGLDIDGCRDVRVANCRISTSDDCIVMKSKYPAGARRDDPRGRREVEVAAPRHEAHDCQNVVVTNCVLESICSAIKIGSETVGHFSDIHVSNCVVRDSASGISIWLTDGGTIERVSYQNISIENRDEAPRTPCYPALIFSGRRNPETPPGTLRDIMLTNIQVNGNHGLVIVGRPDSPIENLLLRNIHLRIRSCPDFEPRRMPYNFTPDGSRHMKEDEPSPDGYQPAFIHIRDARDVRVDEVVIHLPHTPGTAAVSEPLVFERVENETVGRVQVSIAGRAHKPVRNSVSKDYTGTTTQCGSRISNDA